jgi:hypothetical protein
MWDFLSTDPHDLAQFALLVFKEDPLQTFGASDVTRVVKKFLGHDVALMKRHSEIGNNVGVVKDILWFLGKHPDVVNPIIRMHLNMRKTLIGEGFWKILCRRRYDHEDMIDPNYVFNETAELVMKYKEFYEKSKAKKPVTRRGRKSIMRPNLIVKQHSALIYPESENSAAGSIKKHGNLRYKAAANQRAAASGDLQLTNGEIVSQYSKELKASHENSSKKSPRENRSDHRSGHESASSSLNQNVVEISTEKPSEKSKKAANSQQESSKKSPMAPLQECLKNSPRDQYLVIKAERNSDDGGVLSVEQPHEMRELAYSRKPAGGNQDISSKSTASGALSDKNQTSGSTNSNNNSNSSSKKRPAGQAHFLGRHS